MQAQKANCERDLAAKDEQIEEARRGILKQVDIYPLHKNILRDSWTLTYFGGFL